MYVLQRRTTLKNNEKKQIPLLEVVWGRLVDTGKKKVDVMLNFNNNFYELANWYEYVWAVNLRNHKDEDIVVSVLERTSDRRYQKTKCSSPILVTPRLKAISIGFLLPNRDSTIIWRGPMKMNV